MAHRALRWWMFVGLVAATACARAPRTAPATQPRGLTVSDLPAGARVRYDTLGDRCCLRTDRVSRATADTIWLSSGRTVVVATLRRLDISQGGVTDAQRIGWGAAIGAGVGGVLAALVPPDSTNHHRPSHRGELAALGALYGIIIGLGAGLLWPGEQWEPVVRPRR